MINKQDIINIHLKKKYIKCNDEHLLLWTCINKYHYNKYCIKEYYKLLKCVKNIN